MTKRQVWICDNSNIKYQKIKSSFLQLMHEQTQQSKVNYYDFLLVAKKINFRFQESTHLMALKNYFAKNKNIVGTKKIADLLCISQESLHTLQEKIIVKFNVPDTEFAPIKEQTHQDEQLDEEQVDLETFQKIGGVQNEEERQINEKMAIILSIKVDQMQKKIKSFVNQKENINLIHMMKDHSDQVFNFDQFKIIIVNVLGELKQKIKMSEDDIKTIFFILDQEKNGTISGNSIKELKNATNISLRLKQFYKSRINKNMVKNTLFKLGKVKNNTIQIYQVKNASLMEFQNIQRSIVEDKGQNRALNRVKHAKIPHFGPLKGAATLLSNKNPQTIYSKFNKLGKGFQSDIRFQRDKIDKILKLSKQDKHKNKNGGTVASKLRSLFIHKVILPRQKMLQQQKQKYMKHKIIETDLFVKSTK